MENEEHIKDLMEILKISREEALAVVAYDKEVDKMTVKQAESDLTADQKQASKNARITHCADAYGRKRVVERKANNDKQFLINLLNSALVNSDNEGFGTNPQIEITNAEREIVFTFNEKKYKIVLSAPRK